MLSGVCYTKSYWNIYQIQWPALKVVQGWSQTSTYCCRFAGLLRLRVRRPFLLACRHCLRVYVGAVAERCLTRASAITHLWGRGRCSRWWRQRRCDQSEVVRPIRHPSLGLSQARSLRLLQYVLVYVLVQSGILVPYPGYVRREQNKAPCWWFCAAKGRSVCAVFPPIYSQPSAPFLPEYGVTRDHLVWTGPPLLLLDCYCCWAAAELLLAAAATSAISLFVAQLVIHLRK